MPRPAHRCLCQNWQFVPKAAVLLMLLSTVLLTWPGPVAHANPRYAGLVVDAVSGEVFYESDANDLRYPASLTKMMTLYMTFQALDAGRLRLQQPIGISRHADRQPPTHLGLRAGSRLTVEQAIYALITRSANDVSVALAEAIGRTESRFARLMTEQARRLGMRQTTFRNASGLPNSGQRSTARDMARLGQALLNDFPHYYDYFGTVNWRFRGTGYRNHNGLLRSYDGVDGIKTGFIRASGYNIVASAQRGRLRLIAVVFGGRSSSSRNAHVADLLDRAFTSERGRYLIAHGSMPFVPPFPGRHPTRGTTPTLHLAGLTDATRVITVPPFGAAAATVQQSEASSAMPDGFSAVPLPPRSLSRTPPTLAELAGSVAAGPLDTQVGGDLATEVSESWASDSWAIQLGAFADPVTGDSAIDRAIATAPGLLRQARHRIIPVTGHQGEQLYRARFTGLTDQTANAACAQLVAADQICLTIAPLN